MLKFSVVIPIYNEEKTIVSLYLLLKKAMDELGQSRGLFVWQHVQVLCINNGHRVGEIKVRHLYRRYGKTKYSTRNRLFRRLIDLISIN